ncbi:FAD-dependent oxidoreductase [Pseudarthrobacter sp. J75]|uniref:NAD(P)/FAD-dependent oxidoreductase n=1 Tax=unclassified Pseudarthrobacter TaxID=2647000 RepID=UPI002E81E143|nr:MULTISPECIES: FAD-dependent oxidoreductase [unclassified Pseudarthrobacter]MEE2523641.1 FAD-dependent oxidoreductase [Pseudarthrobacter sp. J47]MEE2530031.1 FAD-dependent oxidoreductase [Pseudarthrobacter sp. J75]
MTVNSVTIVGGGMAGFTVAKELRSRGFTGGVTIIDPAGAPYDRPPLSKDYLLGKRDHTEIQLAADHWFEDQGITIVTGKAASLKPDAGTVVLEDGREVTADRVVLATGGTARRLPIPGGDLDSVLELRTKEDADRLRAMLKPGARLAIIGAGLIGAEVASSALPFGADVVLIDPVDPPLVPAVGHELANRLHAMHPERGIDVVTGTPTAITADAEGKHHIELASGETITADAVLVGIGIVPETALAESAGLETDNGTIVDESQRTAHPRVYAVGDSSRIRLADGTLLRRAEHWEHAMNTGATAAAALLEQELPKHGASWFWSDRHGVHVEGVGSMVGEGTVIVREKDGEPSVVFRLDPDGFLAGCAAVDGGLAVRAARRIIDRRIPVDPAQLADPAVDLKKLAR